MYTTNNQGFLNEVEALVTAATETYKAYLTDLLSSKTVEDLSLNEMSFIRLVSSSSILNMTSKGLSKIEVLNKPVCKPIIQKSQPLTKDAVKDFLNKLTKEERAKLLNL